LFCSNSVQTALEEDAPGLLEVFLFVYSHFEIGIYIELHGLCIWQVLVDKGVLVDDIKLYGETVNDEALDESLCEDSFSELEAVMTKVKSMQ
jgi:hypothetical protein